MSWSSPIDESDTATRMPHIQFPGTKLLVSYGHSLSQPRSSVVDRSKPRILLSIREGVQDTTGNYPNIYPRARNQDTENDESMDAYPDTEQLHKSICSSLWIQILSRSLRRHRDYRDPAHSVFSGYGAGIAIEVAHISVVRKAELLPSRDISRRKQCDRRFHDIGFIDIKRRDFAVRVAGMVLYRS